MRGATRYASEFGKRRLISIHTPHAGSDLYSLFKTARSVGFQSTLPMRGATRTASGKYWLCEISIHTPHAGSDVCRGPRYQDTTISIHTPHAGSDRSAARYAPNRAYFNPHSPCGERPKTGGRRPDDRYFNPHSPCGERLRLVYALIYGCLFQSTLPMRGATVLTFASLFLIPISIHTPHAGSDVYNTQRIAGKQDFNPHSPCGERLPVRQQR